ncbi:Mu-like prophage FluMu protein gp29 [Duganella caerulea]|uniref:phage portal protein family protein n=1 Tax=Duganella caerulea TaxID=2885762 RepID=UPI0030E81971
MALNLKPFLAAFSAAKRTPTAKEMTGDIAPPAPPLFETQATGEVRRVTSTATAVTYTPDAALKALKGAQSGQNLTGLVDMGMAVLRRSPKLRSLMATRVMSITSLPRLVESAGTSRQDKKALAACQALAQTPHFKNLVRHLAWASYFGWQGAQVRFGSGTEFWPVENIGLMPPSWFAFDAADGSPLLLPAVAGEKPTPLAPYGKFIFHTPSLLPGQPHLNGLAYTAVFYACLLDVIQGRGSLFVELFAMPLRLGKFPRGAGPEHQKNLSVMRQALEHIGADAWAIIPEEMQIEFLKDSTVQGSIETYERWSRYFDELLTQLILGGSLTSGTSNTGSGGSQALGVVHNELRADIMRADASDIADTIVRDLFTPFVQFNFAGAVVPSFTMPVEEAEDTAAKASAMQGFMDRGVQFLVSDVHSLLQTTEPQDGDKTVGGTTAPAAATGAPPVDAKSALTAHVTANTTLSQGNPPSTEPADVANGSEAAIKSALLSFIEKSSVADLQALLMAGLAATRQIEPAT